MLAGCAGAERPSADFEGRLLRHHAGDDDLLTAGLGLDGLRRPPPLPADRDAPEPEELRRVAIHANYGGLVDLTASGGLESDDLPAVPGREMHAWLRLAGRSHPARVAVMIPDDLDRERPCLVVAPSSGSRGIYGALPVAGPWALPRGCALAMTDKGAGTDLFDHASDSGVTLDGTRAGRGAATLGLAPPVVDGAWVSIPHAHSGDHPEADWGRYTIEAARFGLDALRQLWPDPSQPMPEVRVIAFGLSNGGGAVLRALEQAPPDLFDAAVVGAPNVTPPGARPLYDYATEAALFQPCVLGDPAALAGLPFANPMLVGPGRVRCESLVEAGLLERAEPAAAREVLEAGGFDAGALEQLAVNTSIDVWRAVAALYASAYLRAPVDAMPCGYGTAVLGADGRRIAAPAAQRNLWWAQTSGVVPGGGVEWFDPRAIRFPDDPDFGGLVCLRELWTGDGDDADALRRAVEATRATGRLPDVPVVVVHGRQDGLIPAAFSARPYVAAARAAGAEALAYWEVDGAQHFDSLVPFPGMNTRYRPLIPVMWDALDRIDAILDGEGDLGGDRVMGGEGEKGSGTRG
ncbi:D-(-)-3-hydroxybutyrate oligomer hydrolase [Halomonas denitrificans]|nr:D-(-)-3-hydroxybutyrate oligomer hydrolase [Halomonas denitrificans]